jgi:RNA polymerase sigma-70 factor (ECF subfamily)
MKAGQLLVLTGEQALIERCRRGDEAAWRRFITAHHKQVYNVAYGFFHDPDLAEDVTQETFVRAYLALGRFRGEAKLRTWLTRIAVNLCLRQRQKLARIEVVLDDPGWSGREMLDRPGYAQESAVNGAMRASLEEQVREAIAQLPEEYRATLILADLEGHTYEEVAAILGTPVGTIKSRINRGRRRLREMLVGRV